MRIRFIVLPLQAFIKKLCKFIINNLLYSFATYRDCPLHYNKKNRTYCFKKQLILILNTMKRKNLTVCFVLFFSLFAITLNAQSFNEQMNRAGAEMGKAFGKAMAKKVFGDSPYILDGNVKGLFYETDDNHIGFYAENISKHNFDLIIIFYRPSTDTRESNQVKLPAKTNMEYHPQDFNSDWIFKKGDAVIFTLANGVQVSWTCPTNDRYYNEQVRSSNNNNTIVIDNSQVRSVTQPCGTCNGTKKCHQCHGTGVKTYWVSTGQKIQECGGCRGTGSCQICLGTGVMHTSEYR